MPLDADALCLQGHMIKNPKTQLSQALHSLPARHRLVISGTPIQNNLLELHALCAFAVGPVGPLPACAVSAICTLLSAVCCWQHCSPRCHDQQDPALWATMSAVQLPGLK